MPITEAAGPVKFAKIDLSATGDIVTAVAGKRIRILSYKIQTSAAVTGRFQSGGTTDLEGACSYAATGGVSCNHNPCGWMQTAVGEKLNLVIVGSGQVSGHLTYQEAG